MSIKLFVLHCSATPPSMDCGVEKIREWHKAKGWADIGYHGVIRRDGTFEIGRDLDGDGDFLDETGAHAYGFNRDSIGFCLEGGVDENMKTESNFTRAQYECLFGIYDDMTTRFPEAKWKGHNEISDKDCPSLNVIELFKKN